MYLHPPVPAAAITTATPPTAARSGMVRFPAVKPPTLITPETLMLFTGNSISMRLAVWLPGFKNMGAR